jgi:hypothetical protein
MIGQYLPNNNENSYSAILQNFLHLNPPLVESTERRLPPPRRRTQPPTADPLARSLRGCAEDRDDKFHCNWKLIGARYFNKCYAAAAGALNAPETWMATALTRCPRQAAR